MLGVKYLIIIPSSILLLVTRKITSFLANDLNVATHQSRFSHAANFRSCLFSYDNENIIKMAFDLNELFRFFVVLHNTFSIDQFRE